MYGPDGVNGSADGSAGTIVVPEVGIAQSSGVSMWDITVRSGSATTGPNKPGRIYVDYLAQISGANGTTGCTGGTTCQIFSTLYAVTTDGFVYKIDMNGLDPNGYIFYGNRVGFLQPDGKTPLYHDLVFLDNNLTTPAVGGTLMSPASAKLFFTNPLLSTDLPASILPTPIPPSITNVSYQGSAGGINGYQQIGGTFIYTGNIGGISEIVISRDGVDFSPDTPTNRRLLSQSVIGTNNINWDGTDNQGLPFPVGTGYKYKVTFHAGEYHYPLLDAENSINGGPVFSLLNPIGGVCPLNVNCHTAFYDDRMYRTSNGSIVNTGYTQTDVNNGLTLLGDANGVYPPIINHSDPLNGFDTSTNQRSWGNTNNDQNGFGNFKGLDLWTYYPVSGIMDTLNVVNQITQDLKIVKTHSGLFTIGNNGGSFTLTVSNVVTTATTGSETVTVSDSLPTGSTLCWYSQANRLVLQCRYLLPLYPHYFPAGRQLSAHYCQRKCEPGGVSDRHQYGYGCVCAGCQSHKRFIFRSGGDCNSRPDCLQNQRCRCERTGQFSVSLVD